MILPNFYQNLLHIPPSAGDKTVL